MKQSQTFGGALRALRTQLGLSQEALANTIHSTQRHVSFLETGRSEPTRAMLGRIVAGLHLSAAQRASLFEASGFRSPYPRRQLHDADIQQTLDLLSRQVLRNWPFPAFIVDRDWNFLRTNEPATRMVEMFGGVPNMHALFLSKDFGQLVTNWPAASASFYTRIQQVAQRSPLVREALDSAVAAGRFDHVATTLAGTSEVPIYVPIAVQLPDGPALQFTSVHGRLISVHDAVAEAFEVELMVPLDDTSEAGMTTLFRG